MNRSRLQVKLSELKFLFTAVSSNSAVTDAHGTFLDNEYQDVYLYDGVDLSSGVEDKFRMGVSEVAALRTIRWDQLEASLVPAMRNRVAREEWGEEGTVLDFVPYDEVYMKRLHELSGLASAGCERGAMRNE